jgi:hypothetical protein
MLLNVSHSPPPISFACVDKCAKISGFFVSNLRFYTLHFSSAIPKAEDATHRPDKVECYPDLYLNHASTEEEWKEPNFYSRQVCKRFEIHDLHQIIYFRNENFSVETSAVNIT